MLETNKNAVTVLYSGGDIQVPFVFYDAADLVVLYDTTRKTLNTDYTVTGAGNASGGKVKLTNAPASGTRVTVLRLIDFVQLLEIPSNGILPEGALNRALDRIVMMIQQLAERADRAVTYPAGTDKGIVLNIVEILRDVNAATGDARGSATAAAASADEAKEFARLAGVAHQSTLNEKERVHAEGDAQVLRISQESTGILEAAAGMVPNTDVSQVAPPEWAAPEYGATIHGGTLKVHPARVAYSSDSLASTTFWMCSDPEGKNIVYPRHTEVVTDENDGLSHDLHIHYLTTNATYYPFCEQKSNKGAVSRVAAPLKVVTADVLQFIAPLVFSNISNGDTINGAGLHIQFDPITVDPSQAAQHVRTELRVLCNGKEHYHAVLTHGLLNIHIPYIDGLSSCVAEARAYDNVRGWSEWSRVTFSTKKDTAFVSVVDHYGVYLNKLSAASLVDGRTLICGELRKTGSFANYSDHRFLRLLDVDGKELWTTNPSTLPFLYGKVYTSSNGHTYFVGIHSKDLKSNISYGYGFVGKLAEGAALNDGIKFEWKKQLWYSSGTPLYGIRGVCDHNGTLFLFYGRNSDETFFIKLDELTGSLKGTSHLLVIDTKKKWRPQLNSAIANESGIFLSAAGWHTEGDDSSLRGGLLKIDHDGALVWGKHYGDEQDVSNSAFNSVCFSEKGVVGAGISGSLGVFVIFDEATGKTKKAKRSNINSVKSVIAQNDVIMMAGTKAYTCPQSQPHLASTVQMYSLSQDASYSAATLGCAQENIYPQSLAVDTEAQSYICAGYVPMSGKYGAFVHKHPMHATVQKAQLPDYPSYTFESLPGFVADYPAPSCDYSVGLSKKSTEIHGQNLIVSDSSMQFSTVNLNTAHSEY